jgi:SAM-dependent methyltransferase
MQKDRVDWNDRYRREVFAPMPASILLAYAHRAPMGRALDVACGNGRNACYVASLGFVVDAVDIAEEGLRRFVCRPDGIQRICADLDHFTVPRGRYNLIANIRYLNRRLLPALQAGLAPGGMLIFESYLKAVGNGANDAHHPEHLLAPDELRQAFGALTILDYREHPSLQPEAPAMKASLVAIRPGRPLPPDSRGAV